MKHVDCPPSVWANVIASLMAAGVSRTLAVGIVDILENNKNHINTPPLILSKEQRVNTPKESTRKFEEIVDMIPRVFFITNRLLAAPSLKREHETYQYCRHATLISGDAE